jgi:hypothetical protein
MQNILCDVSSRGFGAGSRWGFATLATLLLSFGVGAATAAFTVVNALAPRAAPRVACETMLQLASSPVTHRSKHVPSAELVQARVSEAYLATRESSYWMRYEAAGDAVSSWPDVTDGLDGRSLASLFAAGALAILVVCARGAARMLHARPDAPIAAGAAIGALLVSAMLIDVLGLPAIGLRGAAFAICVSMLAVRFARTSRIDVVTAAA